MSEQVHESDTVDVDFDDNPQEQAVLLLAAAEEAGHPAESVRTREGGFTVPAEVHKKANSAAFKRKNKSESEDA